MRKKRDHRRGQTLFLFAASSAVLLAFMGLVFDGGALYYRKIQMQAAADAGALSGNWEQQRRNLGLVVSAAQHATKLNGFEHGVETVEVQVVPAGDNRSVEVIIRQDTPTTFMRILGLDSATVQASAAAGLQAFGDACVVALERNPGVNALQAVGGGEISSTCGMLSNSDMRTTGGGFMTASWIGAAGNASGTGYDPPPVSDVPPILDPLAHVPEPDPTGWPAGSKNEATNTYECPGGECVFSSAISVTGGDWTFEPGIYYLQDGMSVTGGNITGNGVMFFNANTSGHDHIHLGGN
ncbi:MAG: pilus assembly protein TadG-related protein, partial [Planctomycetota bacterium]